MAATVREGSKECRNTFRAAVVLGLLGASVAGCSQGIRWRGFTFDRVHADSSRDQKLTFVYFRHWSVIACTDFEETVLKDPAVLEATAELYCVPLDFYWDRPLAEEWGVEAPPGVVILDPQRRVLASLTGTVSVEQLLEAIESARSDFATTTQSTRVP